MNRFLLDETLVAGLEAELSDYEAHHFVKVLRGAEGEKVLLINGTGEVAEASVHSIQGKRVFVKVESVKAATTGRSRVHLCFGIPKSAAFDFVIHRATELGVASFQPLETQHSLHLHSWNEDRWKRVVAEVCKQCEEPFFPALLEPVSLSAWAEKRDLDNGIILCDENQRSSPPIQFETDVYLLIGPEGGWSEEERTWLKSLGALSLGLGKNRLRIETATLVATTLTKKMLGEL
jgi:16S rRNA (uracil1498-N3)-methyltransferase